MDKTDESFIKAIEKEITRWRGFERALRLPDWEAYMEILAAFRDRSSAVKKAPYVSIFEPFVLSVLLAQRRKLIQLEQDAKAALSKLGDV